MPGPEAVAPDVSLPGVSSGAFKMKSPDGSHGATIQTSVDISGGQRATVVKTAKETMVSVIAV
jgi:hypothetical protein